MNRIARISIGMVLIAIGLVSVFIPFLPGALFILAGLVLMGNSRARRFLHSLRHQVADAVGKKWASILLPPHLDELCLQKMAAKGCRKNI